MVPRQSGLCRDARPKMEVWNADELRRFLELVEGHDLYAAFYVKANTGMRRGEVLGLTWRNIGKGLGDRPSNATPVTG